MALKIVLGLLMGLIAGGSSSAAKIAKSNPSLAPINSGWFFFSATTAPVIAIAWIIYTFVAYSTTS